MKKWLLPYSVAQRKALEINGIFDSLMVFFFRAAHAAYGSSQARGRIKAVATSLGHGNAGLELSLRPTPHQRRILKPLSKARD